MEMTCIKCNYVLKDRYGRYYCCNQKEVYCTLCCVIKCEKCQLQKKLHSSCKKCERMCSFEDIDKTFELCIGCLNTEFEKKNAYLLHNHLRAKRQSYLQFLRGFCCLCFKKISKKYICLKDGRRIDSICYECNRTQIVIKISTEAETCRVCKLILGDSLYIQTKRPSYNTQKICMECQKSQQEQKKEVRSPLAQQKKESDLEQQKSSLIRKCIECKKSEKTSYLTNLCSFCSIKIKYYQMTAIQGNNKQQKRIYLFRKHIELDSKQKVSDTQPHRQSNHKEQILANLKVKEQMSKNKHDKQSFKHFQNHPQKHKKKFDYLKDYQKGGQQLSQKDIQGSNMESSIPAPQESPMKKPSQASGRNAHAFLTSNINQSKKEQKKGQSKHKQAEKRGQMQVGGRRNMSCKIIRDRVNQVKNVKSLYLHQNSQHSGSIIEQQFKIFKKYETQTILGELKTKKMIEIIIDIFQDY